MQTGTVWDLVGNTSLVKIKSLSKLTGCEIYAKCEFMNPGGSVKDRAAKFIIAQGEKEGKLKPGGVIVEGTAGNTGIGIATLAAERGYRVIISIPDNQAEEKYQMLEALGAELRKVPAVPFANPNHFYKQAQRMAGEMPEAFFANQFENLANSQAHIEGTGPEIWDQTKGKVDIFTCAIGTAGTISGTGRYLKSKNPAIKVIASDPLGSGIYCHFKEGKLETIGSSVTEGIGIMRLTANYLAAKIDDVIRITDQEMMDMLYHLAENDGLVVGTSSGINVFGAYKLAMANRDTGKTIVTMLCDHGTRYTSRIFNPKWLEQQKLKPQPLVF